jgi:hypothetical protein
MFRTVGLLPQQPADVFSKTPGAKDTDKLFPNRFADYP